MSRLLASTMGDGGGITVSPADVEGRMEAKRFAITIYWVAETINSSVRMYYEGIRIPPLNPEQRIEVPAGVVIPPKDRTIPPREWAERSLRVQRWTEMPRGGHSAAMEEPELLVEEVRAFFHPLRSARPDQLWCRWRSSRGHRLAVLHPRGGGAS